MKRKFSIYKEIIADKEFILSLLASMLLLGISLVINFYAGTYAARIASNSVTDIILSNTRVYDLDGAFVYGSFIFLMYIVFTCLRDIKEAPFVLKSISLFVLIRSLFITLTHIGPFPAQEIAYGNLLSKFSFGGDLFFSGHTGLPFLLALIFWHDKYTRYIFLTFSLMFAVVVLLAHIHYSIDVLSAFFITYTIYKMSAYLFKR